MASVEIPPGGLRQLENSCDGQSTRCANESTEIKEDVKVAKATCAGWRSSTAHAVTGSLQGLGIIDIGSMAASGGKLPRNRERK